MAELQTTHSAGKTQLSVKIQIQGDRRLELLRRSENLRGRTNLPGNELLVPRPHPFVQTRSLAAEIWVCPGGWRGCRAPRRVERGTWGPVRPCWSWRDRGPPAPLRLSVGRRRGPGCTGQPGALASLSLSLSSFVPCLKFNLRFLLK